MAQRCTAKAKSTGEQCGQPVVRGKDKCRFHGGLTPIVHGLYSKYRDPQIAARAAELVGDEKLTDLRPPIADLRARLERWQTEEQGTPSLRKLSALSTILDRLGSLVEREQRIREGITIKLLTEHRVAIVQGLVMMLTDHPKLTDADLKTIAARLGNQASRG